MCETIIVKVGDRVWITPKRGRVVLRNGHLVDYRRVVRVNAKTVTVESFNTGFRDRVPYSAILEVVSS